MHGCNVEQQFFGSSLFFLVSFSTALKVDSITVRLAHQFTQQFYVFTHDFNLLH